MRSSSPGILSAEEVDQYELDKTAQLGPDLADHARGHDARRKRPHMYDETPAQLVEHLEHPNGWWRDTAQKLLVLAGQVRRPRRSTRWRGRPPNQLARIHALWTLEGLGVARRERWSAS